MTSESRGQLTYLSETYDLSSKPSVFVMEGKIEERTNFLEIDEKIAKKLGRRGYIGIWEIFEDQLFLNDIAGCYEKVCDDTIFADWFSGPLGFEVGPYIHTRFGRGSPLIPYKKTSFEIEKGVVRSVVTKDNGLLYKQITSTAKKAVADAKRTIASRPFNIWSYIEGFLPWKKELIASARSKDRLDTLLQCMHESNPLLMARPGALEMFDSIIVVDRLWDDPEFSITKQRKREREMLLGVFSGEKDKIE
tara:strand:+ start:1076 stop:1822 length:747 start_codon:yes stop_codon:yes gene_type:complete